MNPEFKKIVNETETRYVLEFASAGGTSSGSVASNSASLGRVQKRDNILAQETDDSEDPCWRNYKQIGTKKKNGKTVPNCVQKENTGINEGPNINSTMAAILNDIGEPVQLAYRTLSSMAEKYVDNNGSLAGFHMVASGAAKRWYDQFYFNKLGKELRHLVQQAPRHSAQLSEFLSTMPANFSQVAKSLPEILMALGKHMGHKQLVDKANAWANTRDRYFDYLDKLKLESEEETPVSTSQLKDKEQKSSTGAQFNQVEQLVADILRSLPSNVAGDIRNAIARSPNKLVALQQELAKRDISPKLQETDQVSYESAPPGFPEKLMMKLKKQYPGNPERAFATAWSIHKKKNKSVKEDPYVEGLFNSLAEKLMPTDSLRTWKNTFQNANPYTYRQFKNKNRAKKDQMATSARYKSIQKTGR